ncbi:hypothetical protein, partial [Burkholderia pseudomallei]|uniref:hypothetical protein n=1 Tax=Burkholderia pseudomallei TaxID=28450 RepID=UPI00059C991A
MPFRVVRKSPSPIGEDVGRAAGPRNGAFARFASPGSSPVRSAGLPLRAPVGSIESLARPPVRLAGRRFRRRTAAPARTGGKSIATPHDDAFRSCRS